LFYKIAESVAINEISLLGVVAVQVEVETEPVFALEIVG